MSAPALAEVDIIKSGEPPSGKGGWAEGAQGRRQADSQVKE